MSDHERDLRDALQARADQVPVGHADEAGLVQRIAAARRRRQHARLAAVAAAVALVLGATTLVAANDEEPSNLVAGPGPSSVSTVETASTTTVTATPLETTVPPAVAPTTTAPAATTTAPTTLPRTTTTAAPLPPLPDDALWPWPGTTTRFASPEQVASDFARRFLGVSPFLKAPKISGAEATIEFTPGPTATLTTVVSLRRIDVRGWIVVGCAAPSIVVDQPAAGAAVTSPLTVRGRTQAFEGHVDVEVRSDGMTAPLGRSFGTGASDQMAPYEASVTFTRPPMPRGTVVVSEPNAEDGAKGPLAATVVRIRF